MYISAQNETLEIVLSGTVTTNQLEWMTSFQDVSSVGANLNYSSSQGLTNNTSAVTIVDALPTDCRKRQITEITIYNKDTANAQITISKKVGSSTFTVLKQTLSPASTLSWVKSSGWQVV